jgi:outer membrane protein assembly factor BamE (lipoprotein component of BamABCDE complex)
VLGTPSTVSTVGSQTWYYVSEKMEIGLRFMGPKVVDRHVVVINFSKNNKVEKIANYGLQDGQVFDFVTRTTPTAGAESSFVRNMFSNLLRFS